MDKDKIKMVVAKLKAGGVGVLPTDTLYGLVGQALNPKAVAKIAKLKKRSAGKPFIILISSLKDLEKFGLKIDKKTENFLKTIWPGPVSVALPTTPPLRGASVSLAFRWPKNKQLEEIIKKTGPLVAPSTNPEGLAPATTITEAKNYFPVKSLLSHGTSGNIDFAVSAGKKLTGQPSTLIKINKGKIIILRQGRAKIKI